MRKDIIKWVRLDAETYKKVRAYQFKKKINTFSMAIRDILEKNLMGAKK